MRKFQRVDVRVQVKRLSGLEKELENLRLAGNRASLGKKEAEGKEENEVIHNDIPIPPKKVRKEVMRNRRVRMNASTMTYGKKNS